jgi:hypothetical protein
MKVHEAKVVIFNLHTLFLKIAIAKILEGALGGSSAPAPPRIWKTAAPLIFVGFL